MITLSMVSNFRMQAVMATLKGLQLVLSRFSRYKHISKGVQRPHAEAHRDYGSRKIIAVLKNRLDLEKACQNPVAASMGELALVTPGETELLAKNFKRDNRNRLHPQAIPRVRDPET